MLGCPQERISLELTTVCSKACSFCYSGSRPDGASRWSPDEVVAFVADCAAGGGGVRAVSFGGGEPLEYEGFFDVLERLRGKLFRSFTTNGLLLDDRMDAVASAHPDKVHVSIHFPERSREVERVARQVGELARRGIRSGVNLLVRRSGLEAARQATRTLEAAGIDTSRIVFLPMRGGGGLETPSPRDVAAVAGTPRFQSMTCLTDCAKSPRFCSIGWDRSVAWCSYTSARVILGSLTRAGLEDALKELALRELVYCGGTGDGLVRLSRGPLDGHDLVRRRPGRERGEVRER